MIGYSAYPGYRKKLLLKTSVALLLGITLGTMLFNLGILLTPTIHGPIVFSGASPMVRFTSYSELKTFINRTGSISGPWRYFLDSAKAGTATNAQAEAAEGAYSAPRYSQTNVQVEGVDEADIVKTDGQYIYLVSNGKVLIIEAYPAENARVVAEIPWNGTIFGIYVNGDRLVFFGDQGRYFIGPMLDFAAPWYYGGFETYIQVYDISDRTNPVLTRNVTVDGGYTNSRMIGDYVYVLLNSPVYVMEDNEIFLPSISDNKKVKSVDATNIYHSNVTDYYYSLTMVLALNVQNDQEPIAQANFILGYASSIFVSLTNVYVAIPKYEQDGTQKTEIHKIHVDNNEITYEAAGEVPGYILNQFSMDEYNGYFRIATTEYNYGVVYEDTKNGTVTVTKIEEPTIVNNVYVLNQSMATIGSLEGLASGERIYSARFIGTRCYLVTYVQVDPLFVIDLKDPEDPKVLGELVMPGYSEYLHPYDENILIGIGQNSTEVQGEWWGAFYLGVKVSLYDVSDVEHPRIIKDFMIGDRGTDSTALRDHKAFLFDKELKLLAIPILLAEIDESKYPEGVPSTAYGEYVWQGLYVMDITANDLTLRGRITHIDNLQDGYIPWEYSIERALYIENMLYTISSMKIKISNLTTLKTVNEIIIGSISSNGSTDGSSSGSSGGKE
jgi:inhibitor of cysteine peptidase